MAMFALSQSIESECYRHFGVDNVFSRGKRDKAKTKKRDRVTDAMLGFRSVMNGANPPKTREEAVRAVGGITALLLSYLIRQLAVMVVEWLWDRLQAEEASFSITMKDKQ
jgi:hypothetical protein